MIIDRVLPSLPQSVPTARRLVVDALADLAPDTVDDIGLIVSELATNCVLHAHTAFHITLARTQHQIHVEVTDNASSDPHMRQPTAVDPHGRGLQIVDSFANEWGINHNASGTGKTVWFTINLGHSATSL